MGFVSVFLAAKSDVFDPFYDFKVASFTSAQTPCADNGFAVFTQETADSFDLNTYMGGRDPT